MSWFVGEATGLEHARNRRIVALAGLAPDIDVLAYVAGYIYFGFDRELAYDKVWVTAHHHYTHGIGFAVVTGLVAYALADRSTAAKNGALGMHGWDRAVSVSLLAMLMSLTHVFCDIVAAGPRFPVYPLWPLSDLAWTVSWSWELRDWPNQILSFTSLFAIVVYARFAGRSPLESLSYWLDAWLVSVAQQTPSSLNAEFDERVLGMRRATVVRLVIYLGLAALAAAVVIPVRTELF